tara:strand:+ start:908 stop:2950 length:2043 start_codon:yes stop_codon:yes gene_type:complete
MTVSKILQAAASSSGGVATGLDVTDVFSCYLYYGNDTTQTIVNNIDFSTHKGLVWIKNRGFTRNGSTGAAVSHMLVDTVRGASYRILSNTNNGNVSTSTYFSSFNSNGFTVEQNASAYATSGGAEGGYRYVSWSFRRAPKFFDIQTYTGNGSSQQISHNLGSVPGSIFVKRVDQGSSVDWVVYHRENNLGSNPQDYALALNNSSGRQSGSFWGGVAPTDGYFTVGGDNAVNNNGDTYIAYLFAHNNNDGGFGPNGDQDIIKCGSYAGNGSNDGTSVNLGFEPQWILIKRSGSGPTYTGDWMMFDNMRGVSNKLNDAVLRANTPNAEIGNLKYIRFTPTGFTLESSAQDVNSQVTGANYVYIAIRRGPLSPPTTASSVFTIDQGDSTSQNPQYISNFTVDMAFDRDVNSGSVLTYGYNRLGARVLEGVYLPTNESSAEAAESSFLFDYMNGWYSNQQNNNYYSWMWKRAPKFFDVVTYVGTGSATTVAHNLEVVPEMMWLRRRAGADWIVYHKDIGNNKYIVLNQANFPVSSSTYFNNTTPSATTLTVGTNTSVNQFNQDYIGLLFATRAGISKVGSYTGDGSVVGQTIDCGFSNGAKFVLIKAYGDNSNDAHWYVFDSVRGITTPGPDPWIELDTDFAQQSVGNAIKPNNSGFVVSYSSSSNVATVNVVGETYIFYAVAI